MLSRDFQKSFKVNKGGRSGFVVGVFSWVFTVGLETVMMMMTRGASCRFVGEKSLLCTNFVGKM